MDDNQKHELAQQKYKLKGDLVQGGVVRVKDGTVQTFEEWQKIFSEQGILNWLEPIF